MRITYVFHSCFVIENEDIIIIIDFFKDYKDYVKNLFSQTEKKIYVLSSHAHGDHFNKEILNFGENNKVQYVLSSDIFEEYNLSGENIAYIDKLGEFKGEKITVKAFGSTDIGISFVIEIGNKKIFHAGDLNNWHWNEEVSLEEAKGYENHYLEELDVIYDSYKKLDIVMFPVDPRLGYDYMKGAQQFIEKIQVKNFLPMHFGSNFDKANNFSKVAEGNGVNFIKINNKGEIFDESKLQV
ncbi:MAG: MBL fold metallo-hydrolase [Defluviitaleaceae bacterium]|nr:MBL fold metallo-hydrolase [Defluviitaleaceae bacterium]